MIYNAQNEQFEILDAFKSFICLRTFDMRIKK